MITVCAWCQRMLAADVEDRLLLSHGMCSACQIASQARNSRVPTLVVPVRYADLVTPLEKLLRETGIPVVLDRRVGERRRASQGVPGEDRRRGPDRRENAAAQLH
jgi:hypothetical protein